MLHFVTYSLILYAVLVVMVDASFNSTCEEWSCEEGYTNLEGDCWDDNDEIRPGRRRLSSSSSSLENCSNSLCCEGEESLCIRFASRPAEK